MPLCTVDYSIIGLECQLAIAYLLPSRQDVPAISWCQTVILIGIKLTVDFYLVLITLLSGITGSTIIQRQANGIQNGGLAATRRSYNTEDGTFTQGTFLKVDDFTFLPVQGSEVTYFEFQKFHIQSVVSFLIPSNNSCNKVSCCALISTLCLMAKASFNVSIGLRFRMSSILANF